jgi:hypothetical protein
MPNREQPIRDALAGVFSVTPLTLRIFLGGTPETFDVQAHFMIWTMVASIMAYSMSGSSEHASKSCWKTSRSRQSRKRT